MRRFVRRFVGWAIGSMLALSALVGTPATSAQTQPRVMSDAVIEGTDGRLHELAVSSAALGRDAGVRVLLPAGYDDPANTDRRYPMLLLLHGAGDDHQTWTENTDVEGMTAGLPLIVVMPEAGRSPNSGWYTDWINGPQWETFHFGELLPLVDARYRTLGTRGGRVVAGLSMGGFGAMSYAARHPDLFVGAASFSGAVDTGIGGHVSAAVFELMQPSFGTPNDNVWGPYETSEARWRGHNPTDLAANLQSMSLTIRTGNGVPGNADDISNPGGAALEAGLYPMNLRFDGVLTSHGIAHRFVDRGHGIHSWPYWADDLAQTLPVLMAVLADPPAPPAAFDHRFTESSRAVYGWTFTTDRGVVEFTDLVDVSPAGLAVIGSGTLTVETPPIYAAGDWLVTSSDGRSLVVAPDGGRLRFTIDLGPANTADQFSVDARVAELLALATGQPYRSTVSVGIQAVPTATTSTPALRSSAETGATLPATGSESNALVLVTVALAAVLSRAAAARGRGRGRLRAG